MKRSAGLIWGPMAHHLDHVGVFCALFQLPLIVTEENLYCMAKEYYPDLEVHYLNYIEAPHTIVQSYDTIYSSLARITIDEIFLLPHMQLGKRVNSIWLPHGNSDKGHKIPLMEGLKNEELALVYGPRMVQFMQDKGVVIPHHFLGNFRYHYFLKHRLFYEEKMKSIVPQGKKIILYAPTWNDGENSSSYEGAIDFIKTGLPESYTLLIKPHPNQGQSDIPSIYPLLAMTDIYVGDASSIGYDFLTFNRPMLILNPSKKNGLAQCTLPLFPKDYSHFYKHLEKVASMDEIFREKRETLYKQTFGDDRSWEALSSRLTI
jgi:hypothetical protein